MRAFGAALGWAPILWHAATLALGAALGTSVASFTGVALDRLPRGRSLYRPPSTCSACDTRIAPRDNVPIVSWLLLQGRCRNCGATIPVRLFVLELCGAAVGILLAGKL